MINSNPMTMVIANQYDEKIEGDGYWKATVTTRKAFSTSRAHDGLTGISQLTDLFFKALKKNTRIISHTSEIVRSDLSFVSIKLDNPGNQEGWKEASRYDHPDYGTDITKRVHVTFTPQLTQKVIRCREAILVEKSHSRYQDIPDEFGRSAYILDTSHEWSLTLSGIDHIQTLTLLTEKLEVHI